MRMVNMGIPAYNLATSITLVIAQRLARKLCKHCKVKADVPKAALLEIGFIEEELPDLDLYTHKGCEQCTGGFKGRVGIYEVLPFSPKMGEVVMAGGTAIDIANQMKVEGIINLRRAGLNKVKLGLTSIDEINRVTKD
jgi:type IV pilus assembly protein PilB